MASLALALVSAPVAAGAQPAGKVWKIGFLSLASPEATAPLLEALAAGLRDLGYVEGRNLLFERRFANGRLERLPPLAAELVRLRMDVIVGGANPGIAALKEATATLPIVMAHPVDPIGAGFIATLAHPGGNLTGLSFDAGPETGAKRLQMLKEIVPTLSRVAILRQAESGTGAALAAMEAAARTLGVTLQVAEIRTLDGVEGAFRTMARGRAEALVIQGGPLTWARRQQIADLALRHRLPSTHSLREYAQAGVLLTYGPSITDLYRRAAGYVDKLLKGAKPADLPVEQPTTFELVINLRTAKALGLTIPASVLARADEVIQ
jgi:putative ABC transport system substrate-binding protein